ncbi:MAG TPA: hypothetical protein VG738_05975 [Chitinophagaceae bacterium]|nr:hypothetical protein [Chitinophagaceae bacterium]
MEENLPVENEPKAEAAPTPAKGKKQLPEVLTVRNWKEYLGESLLIIFSVALAIGLTEYFTSLHEKEQAKEILHQLREEMIQNKKAAQLQYEYDLHVFALIDSAKKNPAFAKQFLDSGKIHINVLMPHGAIYQDLNDVAWQEAKQNDIFARIDYETYSLLTDVYNNQERFLNLEPDLARLLISFDARKTENIQVTLTMVHDIFYAWIVERTPSLLQKYQKAIDKLAEY